MKSSILVAFVIILSLTFIPGANSADVVKLGARNPHYLSSGEFNKWRVLCSKIDNEIMALHRRINVLVDMKNRHGKPEELQAMAAAIRSSIDEIFNEVNTELADRKLFKEDSKVYMGKLVNVKRSLEELGKF